MPTYPMPPTIPMISMTPMSRRHFVLAGAAAATTSLAALPARAHHGWSSFDQDRPIYLEGRVVASRWRNPHAELTLEPTTGLVLPPDLARRSVPAQSAGVDGPALLAKAVLPRRADRRWELELAPLTRMSAWNVAEIKPGQRLSAVGFTARDEQGDAVMRVEYLFVDAKAYGLRSSPV
jgi:hypothetical protein